MGRLVYLMRKCHLWIQPHPHGVIQRHLLNMVKLFLCSSTNYFENRLLPNNLIIVRNHRDDDKDKWDIKKVLEVQGNTHNTVEVQSNSESRSPTRSPGPSCLQMDVHDAFDL
jgi:hypothetical protein